MRAKLNPRKCIVLIAALLSGMVPVAAGAQAGQTWVTKATLCAQEQDPIGGTWYWNKCSFPDSRVLYLLPSSLFGGAIWGVNSAGTLGFWSAADGFVNLSGDSCAIRDLVEAADHSVWGTSPTTSAICQARYISPGVATVRSVALPAGSVPDSIAISADAGFWVSDSAGARVLRLDSSGAMVAAFPLQSGSRPSGVAVTTDGALWIALRGDAAIARLDPATALVSYVALPSLTHPYNLTVTSAGQICYLGGDPDYSGCITAEGSVVYESALPADTNNLRDRDSRGQLITAPDGFAWYGDPYQGLVRIDSNGLPVVYDVSDYNSSYSFSALAADSSIAFWFSQCCSPSSVGSARLLAAFAQLNASSDTITEGQQFTLSGTLTLFADDPNPALVFPEAEPLSTLVLSAGKERAFSAEFTLEAARSDQTVSVQYVRNGTVMAAKTVPLSVINLPPTFQNVTVAAEAVAGAVTTIFSGQINDPGKKDRISLLVDFGDDWPPAFPVVDPGQAVSVSHTYLKPGTYAVRYDANDLGGAKISGSASITVVAPDFKISVTSPASTVTAGGAAIYKITVEASPGPFRNVVNFSCSGLPRMATCSFSPDSVAPHPGPASTSLTIRTSAAIVSAKRMLSSFLYLHLAVLIMLLSLSSIRRRGVLPLVLLFLALAMTPSCGDSPKPIALPGTPPGTYTITVTATDGTIQHATPVSLKVE